MKIRQFLWNEFIFGAHWLSLGASAITLFTMILLEAPIRLEVLLISYLGSQCIYNFNHYKEYHIDEQAASSTAKHIKGYLTYHPLLVIIYGILFTVFLIYFGNFQVWIFGMLLLGIGILYTLAGKKIAKKIIGLKSFYIAGCWACIVPLTALFYSLKIDFLVILLYFFVFFRYLVDTVFYDLKDIQSDTKEGVLTFASYFGTEKCLDNLHIINLLSFIPLLIGIFLRILPKYSIILFFFFFYSYYYIVKARKDSKNITIISYILVDGEYFYWPFLLLIGLILIPG